MDLIKSSLLENKFALANFILFNQQVCNLNREHLYVVQIIEQYQKQIDKNLDFSVLENKIELDIKIFKEHLKQLIERKLIINQLELVNDYNILTYNVEEFWKYAADQMYMYQQHVAKNQKIDEYVAHISSKFGRFLSPDEITQIETIIELYNLEILKQILEQVLILDSKYVSTIIELVQTYKEANLQTLTEINQAFEQIQQ